MKPLRDWFGRRRIDDDIHEEMRHHIEARAADLIARGFAPQEAARQARVEFGSLDAHREEGRAALGYRPWDELRSDLRFAVRSLRRQPGYAATAIAILAIAIGVNSAFFTWFSHYVLKPLPIRGAERHFDLHGLDARARQTGGWTAAEIEALQEAAHEQVEGLYSSRVLQMLVLAPVQQQSAIGFVSANYFRLLGGNPASGRTFAAGEQRERVCVLSHSGRLRHFPDDPAPTGKTLRIRDMTFTVIGTMPPAFTGTDAIVPDLWIGNEIASTLADGADTRNAIRAPRYRLSGLLAPGATPAQAEAALTAAAARFERPGEERVGRIAVEPRAGLVAADDGFNVAMALVFGAFLMVLAIACANLANLCLSRAAARTHEIAMRVSLGASRARVVRQLLTESTFLASLGAAGGVAFGMLAGKQMQWIFDAYAGSLGMAMLPVDTDWRAVVFAACLGLLAGIAFGLMPAIEATSGSLTMSAKREQSPFAGRIRPRRMRRLLIAGQVASSLVLLVMAVILVRHIRSLDVVSTGFDLDRIFDLRADRPTPALLALLEEQPFVAGVTSVAGVPLYGHAPDFPAKAGGQSTRLMFNHVDHRYFETMELTVKGRAFTAAEAAANAKLAVISEATARKLWPNRTPIGQTIEVDSVRPGGTGLAGTYEVIGVAPDIVSGWIFTGRDRSAVYFPAARGSQRTQSAMLRIQGPAAPAVAALRKLCGSRSDFAGCDPTSLRELSGMWRFPFAVMAAIAAALGMLALVLTATGLYGVTSYTLLQRRREIGVHLALGATAPQVTRRMLREALGCVAAGLAVGLPVCLVLSRLLSSSVLAIRAFDPAAYFGVPTLLAAIVAIASAIPARRAARLDPMTSLREE